MADELNLEMVRRRTNAILWVLLVADLVIAYVFTRPADRMWTRLVMLGIESSMTLIFVWRRNWWRALIFGLFAVEELRFLVGG